VVKKSETFVEKKPLLSWVFSSNLKILLVITVSATFFVLKAFEMLLIYCGVYLAAVIIPVASSSLPAISRLSSDNTP